MHNQETFYVQEPVLAWPAPARNDRQVLAFAQQDDVARRDVNRLRKLSRAVRFGSGLRFRPSTPNS